jgi:hypothetical protein
MYLVPIAWIYVVLMMSVAEATNTNGTVLGAVFTFLIYGAAPVALILYFMGTPARKRALRAQEAAERASAIAAHASESIAPDASSHATGGAIPPVGKES